MTNNLQYTQGCLADIKVQCLPRNALHKVLSPFTLTLTTQHPSHLSSLEGRRQRDQGLPDLARHQELPGGCLFGEQVCDEPGADGQEADLAQSLTGAQSLLAARLRLLVLRMLFADREEPRLEEREAVREPDQQEAD